MAITNQKKGSVLLIEGLDVSKPGEYISDQSATESLNFEVKEGLLSKRVGTSVLSEIIGGTGDDVEIMAGREFKREGVSYNVRVGRAKTEVYDSSTPEWDDITGTDLTGDSDDIVSTAIPLLSGKRILCITNGKDVIQKWTATGTLAALGGTPPVAKFIQEYKTYLVCANIAGGTDISQRVQWSDTADPETWTGGNSGSVDLVEDGEDITGLGLYGNYLCVHKPGSIYLGYPVSSTNIFQFERKATGVGTIANQSLVNIPTGEQVFVAKDGIRIFNGITAPLIKSPINDEIRSSINANKAHRAYGIIVREKDEVWLGIPIGSQETGETIYKYNYKTGVLYKDSRSNASAMWRGASTKSLSWDDFGDDISWEDYDYRWDDVAFSTDSEQINIGYTTGYTDKIDVLVTEDAGVAIDALWDSKDFQHAQDVISRWKKMELWASGGTVSAYYSIDEGNNWTEMTNSPYTLSASMPQYDSPINFYFDTVASKIRIRFRNAEAESLKIKQFILHYTPRENRS